MEKYRKFADEKTGKHPFLPLKGNQQPFDTLIAVLLLPIRLPLLGVLVFWTMVHSFVFRHSQIGLAKMVGQILAKAFLVVLNVKVTVQSQEEAVKLLSNPAIILSNRSSFIDSLILRSVVKSTALKLASRITPAGKSYEFYRRNEGMMADVIRDVGLTESLPTDLTRPKNLSEMTKLSNEELIRHGDANFHLFFEGLKTNNSFVLALDPMLVVALFKLLGTAGHTLAFAKIVHENKSYANACENSIFYLARCLLQLSNPVTFDCLSIPKSQLTLLDSAVLAHKKLFDAKPSLNILSKDSEFYRQFLDYYAKN